MPESSLRLCRSLLLTVSGCADRAIAEAWLAAAGDDYDLFLSWLEQDIGVRVRVRGSRQSIIGEYLLDMA